VQVASPKPFGQQLQLLGVPGPLPASIVEAMPARLENIKYKSLAFVFDIFSMLKRI